jgi:hypothetical protein
VGLKDQWPFKVAYNLSLLLPSNFNGHLIERNLSLSKKFFLIDDLAAFCEIRHGKDWIKGNYPDSKDL